MSGYDIDRTLADWFQADALAQAPADGLERALGGARQRKPRRAWLARRGSHWGWTAPRDGSGVGVRGFVGVRAFIAAAVVALLLGGVIVVGARLLESPPPLPNARLGQLAYEVDGDIFVADWDGSNPVRIADGLPGGKPGCGRAGYGVEGPMWSPDGRYLAYRSPRSQVICDRPESDRIPTVLISDPTGRVVAEFPGVGWQIAWSPDSTRVATWLDMYPATRVGVYGLDGVQQAMLSLPPFLYGTMDRDDDPIWSHDGQSILVSKVGLNETWEVPVDGRPPLLSNPLSTPWASRSPDGARVAFVRDGRLVVTAADGSQRREMAEAGYDQAGPHYPAWSPAGDRIAYVAGATGGELRVIDVATGAGTNLVTGGGGELLSVIEFSPEGDRILFARNAGGATWSIWSVSASGSEPQMLVSRVEWPSADWQSLKADPGPRDTTSPSPSIGLP